LLSTTNALSLLLFSLQFHQCKSVYNNSRIFLLLLSLNLLYFTLICSIRIRQCLVQLSYPGNDTKIAVMLNIIKYSTSFPPLLFSGALLMGYRNQLIPTLLIVSATINSTCGFLWDIIMDWGFVSVTQCPRKFTFKTRSLYPFTFHIFAVICNFALRFSWVANELPYFQTFDRNNLILILQIAEVFRRCVWIMFRVEWEVMQSERDLIAPKLLINI
jgi:hypothetical protein